ncbi:PAS domain-containing hybrid sensor histidine kinase/response regulator [Desulfoplanes formicivorans]|uniref:histidine kinase n=1 Tax=Desulfoplanes formicivorans TaxID=1592317 RepID=A0A194AKT8_9BACT|nr:PAS domain-containing sensor histidine kinase [Desulfoplanes formicivorans]GAU09855.1 hypothetical protein DPF_2591 [Desulfoplanes formicivorans]
MISVCYSYFLISKEKNHYIAQINEEADFFADKLALSLWKYDVTSMNYLGNMAMGLGHVQSISIFDESSTLLSSHENVQGRDHITLHRDISYQGHQVGSLDVTFAPFDAGPIWVRTMLAAGGLLVPILVLSVLVVMFIVHHYLSLPLNELLAYIQSVSEGHYGRVLSLKGGLEMVSIGRSMQNLSRELQCREERLHEQERELKENLLKYKTLFSTIPMGIVVTDPQGKILELNPHYEKIFGIARNEHVPRAKADKRLEVLRSDGTPVPPEECTEVKALRENRIIAGRDVMHRDANGNIFWLDVTAAPIPLEDYGVVVVISDVTERKILEEDLQAYKYMVSSSNDLMLLIDADHRYRIVNDTFAAYRKRDVLDFIGIRVQDVNKRFDHEGITDKDIDRCLQGESFRCQSWIEYPDKGKRYMDISFQPYTDRETIRGVVVEGRDITDVMQEREEREKLRKQLVQAQKMESIGTLAGGIAHDFNNILASILGYAELSLHSVEPGSNLEKYLNMVYSAAIRAKDLVSQILVFARKSDEELRPIRVASLAKEVLKLIRSSVPSTIEIRSRITSDFLVKGDATRIHQVLMNLLTNAYQAMEDDGGIMEMNLSDEHLAEDAAASRGLRPGDYVRITVSDTGQGIPPEIMDNIFEPYFTTKKQGGGTGMGLALTHSIVKNHGGTVEVQSRQGQGTVFTVFLPAMETRVAEKSSKPVPLEGGSERILFVDDEPAITTMVRDFLEKLGYTIMVTNSSLEALNMFTSRPEAFDLVISDVTMPEMTGDKLIRRLLEIRPDIPVILCTGYSSKVLGKSVSELGARALMNKPFVNADLAGTIRKVLDEHGSSRG